ncbi:MAG: YgcG family protein [Pseudomonadota bacterium]
MKNNNLFPTNFPCQYINVDYGYIKRKCLSFISFFFTCLIIIFSSMSLVWAADSSEIPIPSLTHHVTDLTSTLTNAQQIELENQLKAFETRKGSQIALLIVPTTQPETIEQYALRVVEKWKIGRTKVDDGALFLVAKNDKTMRIEVGYGLEGALNDAVSKQIISNIITPRFQQNDFYGGIQAGIQSIIHIVDGEPLPTPNNALANKSIDRQEGNHWIIFALLIGLFAGKVLKTMFGIFPGAFLSGLLASIIVWMLGSAILMAILAGFFSFFLALTGGRSGFSNGWYSGGSSFSGGGFDNDHFSGGGGGFGGGGASGKW